MLARTYHERTAHVRTTSVPLATHIVPITPRVGTDNPPCRYGTCPGRVPGGDGGGPFRDTTLKYGTPSRFVYYRVVRFPLTPSPTGSVS